MNLHAIDWAIVLVFVVAITVVAFYLKRYNRSVADFLVANRCAGRYMLTISNSMAAIGAISIVAQFEMYYNAGFSAAWWNQFILPLGLLVMISGWVNYRYRETRAMTIGQFFEMRYSRRLRVFCGVISWAAGMLNIGIFPAVTAKFFIFFCNLPDNFEFLGVTLATFPVLMIVELAAALLFTLLGGMLVVIVTDFLQGILSGVGFLIIIAVLFWRFDWDQVIYTLASAPEDASLVNPYRTSQVEGFNMYFFLMMAWLVFYRTGCVEVGQGYVAAARNAHEAKMAGIIGTWRGVMLGLLTLLIPVCAYAFMHSPQFAAESASVKDMLADIAGKELRQQAVVPLVLAHILPKGMLGIFVMFMIAAALTTDDTVLHTWGRVFIQDVILPFRKKPFTPRQQIWLLRFSIVFVAVFIFFFSLLFRQSDFIMMYMTLTISIIVAGFGSLMIGGLYWKRGSILGAWAAVLVGCILSAAGLIIQPTWPAIVPVLRQWFPNWRFLVEHPRRFPFHGVQIAFFVSLCSVACYVAGSLYSWVILRRPAFNLQRLLHRGKYAIKGEHEKNVTMPDTGLRALLPGKEYRTSDKIIYLVITGFVAAWFVFFLIVTLTHVFFGTTDRFWIPFWMGVVGFIVVAGTATLIWLTIGGIFDFRYMLRVLRTATQNVLDDGRVVDHHSIADEVLALPSNNEADYETTDCHPRKELQK